MPKTPSRDELTAILYKALQSPNGLAVTSTSSDRLRQALYKIKRSDDIFAPLTLSLVDDKKLLIIKKKENPDASE